MAHCRVSFTGSDGTVHLVTVDADSLYEAIGLAVAEFRSDKLTDTPGPMTEFTVAIERPPVEHRIRFIQVVTESKNPSIVGLGFRGQPKESTGGPRLATTRNPLIGGRSHRQKYYRH